MSDVTSQVVLHNGTVLDLNANQEVALAYAILTAKDVHETEVKLNGVRFKLKDMMDSAEREKFLKKKRKQDELDKQQGLI